MLRPIAIATPRYAPAIGGVERHVEALARGLAGRGIPVEVLTTDPTGQLPRLVRRGDVTVRRFPTLAGDSTYFPSPRLLRWVLERADDYRLVHVHGYHTLVLPSVIPGVRNHQVPLVVTPHYHATGHTRFRALLHVPYRPVAGRILRSAAAVIAVSEAERSWLERDFGQLPIRVLPNGVDLDPSAASGEPVVRPHRPPGRIVLLSVGRLEAYKGVDRIVTALPHLDPGVRLTVVGKGPAADTIERTAAELGVTDRVRLVGQVAASGLRARYGTADLFVTMSREEAFGMTVLEAAAAGAPVLASDIPAHREVRGYVAEGRIALVDPAATGEHLAAAITNALRMGRTSDRTGWRLPTWEGMVDGVEEVYTEVLGAPVR